MGLFCVELAAFACADDFLRVAQCRWPVESLSESFSEQGAWCSMVSIDSGVYLKKKFLALGNGDTLLLTLLSAPICIPQAHGSCSFSLRVFPPRFINLWIDKELPKVFHLI